VWSYSNFLNAWHYFEPNSTRKNPYFGVAFIEWKIEVSPYLKSLSVSENILFKVNDFHLQNNKEMKEAATIEAKVNYICPPPFDCSSFPASNVLVSLDFGEQLGHGVDFISPSSSFDVGTLKAGEIATATWSIRYCHHFTVFLISFSCTPKCSKMRATVTASGIIHGSVPSN
jgi:hypothetical protein